MKKLGIVGCGKIGGPVIAAVAAGTAGPWRIVSVLARTARPLGGVAVTADPGRFFREQMDLIVETAGPTAFRQWGIGALTAAPVWTVSGMALADPDFYAALEKAGRASGHRLRVLAGALAGLDGVAALAVDPAARVTVRVDVAPGDGPRTRLMAGTARAVARDYPDHVNVAVAASLAGRGLDDTAAEVWRPGPGEPRRLGVVAESAYGRLETQLAPRVAPAEGIHTVAAGIIAALRTEGRTIWAG